MKSTQIIIGIIILAFGSTNANAQTAYDTCNKLQPYEGEWRYTNGQDTIRIYLKAARVSFTYPDNSNTVRDDLYGWHEYKKGNIVVESNYQNRFTPIPYNYDDIQVGFSSISLVLSHCDTSTHKLIGSIDDITEIDEYHTVTAILSNNNTVMSWKLVHREGYGFPGGHKGMTLPKTFVLIKQ